MKPEEIRFWAEIIGGAVLTGVLLPWCVWVTTSIFNQRQQIALMKAEMGLLKEIKDLLSTRGKRR